MAKNKRPAYYPAPPKSRKDMIGLLDAHTSYWRDSGGYTSPLAWNVKCYDVDFDADHLIEVYRTSGEYDNRPDGDRWLDYPEWRIPALSKLIGVAENLYEWAIEDARRQTEDDTNRCLWRGPLLDVKYEFSGRSGGWLVMTEHEGADLTKMDAQDFAEYLADLDYQKLRNLCELVLQNDHDFRRQAVKEAIEFAAAFAWIENVCSEVVRPEKTQAELLLA